MRQQQADAERQMQLMTQMGALGAAPSASQVRCSCSSAA
jgi:hypothetical protein